MVQCIMDAKTARMLNLRNIIEQDFNGHAGKCADVLGVKRPQLNRWITKNQEARQGISEDSARMMEAKLGKPRGSLDAFPEAFAASDDDAKVIAEFAWIYTNATEEGRTWLCNTIRTAAKAYLRTDRRMTAMTVVHDRRTR